MLTQTPNQEFKPLDEGEIAEAIEIMQEALSNSLPRFRDNNTDILQRLIWDFHRMKEIIPGLESWNRNEQARVKELEAEIERLKPKKKTNIRKPKMMPPKTVF